jgi:PAS domain S-box-containing protein
MGIFIFSTLVLSIFFLLILGSWYSIQGPFLLHIVMLILAAITIFSAAILIALQPIFSPKSSRSRRDSPQDLVWGREFSEALSSPAAVLDGLIVRFANTPFLQILGMTGMADQIIGMPFTNLIHPADHQNFAVLGVETALDKSKNSPSSIRLICADGTTLPSNVSLSQMREGNTDNLMLFQFTPISTIHPLSDDFEAQFNYHSIIDRLEEIVFQLNAEGKIIFINPAWENLLEYKVKSCVSKLFIDFFHPEDKPTLKATIDSLTQGKRTNCTLEARLLSKNGHPNWVMLRAKTTSTSSGERTSVIGTMLDIQRNKEAEASLLANRRALNSLLNNVPGMVYRGRNDRSWTFEFVSEGCIDITGYSHLELVNNSNLNFNLIIHPEDRAGVWESVNHQLSLDKEFKLIYRIITRQGDTKLIQEHGRGVFSSTGDLLALEGFITEIPKHQYSVNSLKSIPY